MVDEIQKQKQMMFTDPNKQHYGPAGGPNKWDMDYPSGGMPTNYQGNSPHFRSGNLDVRYPGDYAHQQNQGRPYGGPGQPSHGFWQQMGVPKDTYPHELQHQGMPRQHRQHPNPRMRGMMGGLGGLQEKSQLRRPEDFTNLDMLGRPDLSFRYSHIDPSQRGVGTGGSGEMANRPDYFRDDRSIRGTWRMMEDARRADEMDEYGYLEGAPRQRTTFTEGYMDPADFDEMYGGYYDDAIFRTVDPNTNRIEQYPQAGESEQSKIDLKDIFRKYPGLDMWQLIQNLDKRGIEYANRGGIMGVI